MTSKRKVISVTNGHDKALGRTITNTGGGVLVRIGERDHAPEHHGSRISGNEVTDDSDARQRQRAKNAAYRQSSTRQFIDANNNNDNNYTNSNDEAVADSGHLIYTKVASVKEQPSSHDPNTKSFITRKITKGRLSEYVQNGVDSTSTKEDRDRKFDQTIESSDPANRKKLNYMDDGSMNNLPKNTCFSCRKTVYQKEKLGPIRDVQYHKQCFRCCVCGFVLNLTNFHQNCNDLEDKGVYCKSHEPVAEQTRVNIQDKTIQAVINKPKVEQLNPNIRIATDADKIKSTIDAKAVSIKGTMNSPKLDRYNQTVRVNQESPKSPRSEEVKVKTEPAMNGPRRAPEVSGQKNYITVGVKTAMNSPKVAVYNPTVRPVPAMVYTAPPKPDRNPSEYKSRQIRSADFTQTPTPPSPPQHVHFNGNTKTYYYIGKK